MAMAVVWAPWGVSAETDLASPRVVVTANRFEQQADETPIGVTVITADQIRESGARTLPEVLSREVGFTVRDNSGSPNRQIDLRGFGITGDQNTLVLVNGQRISENELTPADLASISLGTVERIEILRSSGAVLYGGGATGGTVNVITRGPRPQERSAQLTGTAGSYDTQGVAAGVNLATERLGLGINAARLTSDNYRYNNALSQENLAGDLTLFGDRGPVSLKFSKVAQELGLPGARTEAQLSTDRRGATNPDDFSSLDDTRVTLGTTQRVAGDVELALDLTHRERKSRTFQFGGNNDINGRVTGAAPRLRIPFMLGPARNSLVVGGDWDRWNFNNSISSFGYFGTSQQENAAIYFQDTVEFPTRTVVSIGARAQRVDTILTENTTSQQVRNVNANELALRQGIGDEWSVYGKIGRSFRLPVVDEIRSFGFGLPNLLEPQTSRDAELGVQVAQPGRRARLAVFQSRLENEIMFVPFALSAFSGQNVNLPPTRRTGLEFDGTTLLGQHWEAGIRYAYTEAEFRSGTFSGIDVTGNEIPLVPRHKAGATLAWRPMQAWLVNAIVTFIGEQRYDGDQANTFDRKMPSYTLLDVNAAWTQGWLTLRASVLNATDVKYYSYAVLDQFTPGNAFNAYPAADRTLLFTAELRFGNR
jgi:iron complex outermembrane recepter protein